MSIELEWEIEPCIDDLKAFLEKVGDACMQLEGITDAGFSVRIVDADTIHALNRETRGVDAPTDVLSFPTVNYPKGTTAKDNPKRLAREYDPYMGCINLGDCVLNLDRARSQAQEYGHSLRRELGYLTAHSVFHLMGYDHMTDEDKRVMRAMEEKAMEMLNLKREDYSDLVEQAWEAMKNSYAPYSHHHVGACILAANGKTYKGCNFENASYGATICAERCAAACAVADGQYRFQAIAIVADEGWAWPCGICRQVLREFSELSLPVIVAKKDEPSRIMTLGELLPESFGPDDLHIDVSDR